MRVAVIGAGFSGLALAYRLAKRGVKVNLFEGEDRPGGLAAGFTNTSWEWSLEKHYHHWFTNDGSILDLAKEIGYKVDRKPVKTSVFLGKINRFDSPLSLFLFPELSIFEKLRMGSVLAFLKLNNNWKILENISAKDFIRKSMGERSWQIIWQPLFVGKFGKFADKIPASWFWARIKKRTSSLCYPEGGFLSFALRLTECIQKYSGIVYFKVKVHAVRRERENILLKTDRGIFKFDRVVCTLPTSLFVRITQGLDKDYHERFGNNKFLGALNLVLSLKNQFLEDGTYWLNINVAHFPFLAVVEHTNFIDKKYYGGENILYIGNYLPHYHKFFQTDAKALLEEYYPFLKSINPRFDRSWINKGYLFKNLFAQPIITLGYSQKIPPFKTPIKGLYLCNMDQVYPWDRGTNYAVENANKVSDLILKTLR